MPDLPPGGEIYAETFNALGRAMANGFGPAPLTFAEIAAGAPWADERDRMLIRKMSDRYLAGLKSGEDPFAIDPMDRR